MVSEFPVLGHILQGNGSSAACWRQTHRSMWKANFGNCRASQAARLGVDKKLKMMQRCVVPSSDSRNMRWPPHVQLSQEIDRLQRKMVASCQREQFTPGEAPADYVRRRNRVATKQCTTMGLWSTRHCERVLAWRDHIRRPANSRSWPAVLQDRRGFQWLLEQRAANNSGLLAGRTGTRVSAGQPAVRWHDTLCESDPFLIRP